MVSAEALNILWIVICSGLVLVMQGGFLCLETGLTRSKNAINVALKNAMDLTVALLVFWLVGYGLMFGTTFGGFFGLDRYYPVFERSPFDATFFVFQALFCGTAVTIVSGAVAERLAFFWYLIISALIAGVIYPLFGHWAWNGLDGDVAGWLGAKGFVDWAGSTVVHSVGGWVALAVLLVVGPRQGRFRPDGSVVRVTGSSLPMVSLGAILLWFGWFGFNAGSTLAVTVDIGPIVAKTALAAAAGGFMSMLVGAVINRQARFLPSINGILAGLVAITAGCHAVSMGGAIVIGAIGGVVCMVADWALLRARIDDAVSAVPVHLAAGIWGTLAVALFGQPEKLGTGLNWLQQLTVQAEGVGYAALVAFVPAFIIFGLLNKVTSLRVSAKAEQVGLNVAEHGMTTEMFDFVNTLSDQAKSGDITKRVPVEPFTEIGQIGEQYNRVMDSLEDALAKTDAIVRTSNDAILIFDISSKRVIFNNPPAERMFGFNTKELTRHTFSELFPSNALPEISNTEPFEAKGLRADGKSFPVEMSFSVTDTRSGIVAIGTLRDITERKHAEAVIRASENRFRAIYRNAALGIAVLSGDGRVIEANPALTAMLQTSLDKIRMRPVSDWIHEDDLQPVHDTISALSGGLTRRGEMELRLVCPSNIILWGRIVLTPVDDMTSLHGDDIKPMVIALVEDMTNARGAREAMTLAASVFENTQEAIVIFDANGTVIRCNRAYRETSGYSDREINGFHLTNVASARYDQRFFDQIYSRLETDGSWQGEMLVRRKDGELIPTWLSLTAMHDDHGEVERYTGIFNDLTERKETEEVIWRHANFDAVTGLPNRRLFNDRLDHAIKQSGRRNNQVGLLFLDLDRFKQVNDTHGHQVGDALLVEVASRLKSAVRASDTVARLGGDEFTVIVENFGDQENLEKVAKTIIDTIVLPTDLNGKRVDISTSIGVAIFPEHGKTASDLIRHADAALYQAKDLGRNGYQFFDDEIEGRLTRRAQLEANIRKAIEDDAFYLVYQPQWDVASETIVGLEALVRWQTDTGEFIGPDSFIPFAEETGLIRALGQNILRCLIRDMSAWQSPVLSGVTVSMNVSAQEFRDDTAIAKRIDLAFKEANLPLSRLVVEITETGLMTHRDAMMDQLHELEALGVNVSLDDFGRGYSSLARLKNLPIGELKLDKAFVDGLPGSKEDSALATAVIHMANGLGIEVVAEGVERPEQLLALKQLGCQKCQGYLLARPMLPADLEEFVQSKVRQPA